MITAIPFQLSLQFLLVVDVVDHLRGPDMSDGMRETDHVIKISHTMFVAADTGEPVDDFGGARDPGTVGDDARGADVNAVSLVVDQHVTLQAVWQTVDDFPAVVFEAEF